MSAAASSLVSTRLWPMRLVLTAVVGMAVVGMAVTGQAVAYSPESPEVQDMLKKATAYLEKEGTFPAVGGQCLVGLALVKAGCDVSHPRVQEAVKQAFQLAETAGKVGITNHIYNEAIACFFLSEVAPEEHRAAIGTLLQVLLKHQRSNGCWSYGTYTYDDTSQTQYGVLCLWAAHQHGFPVPVDAVERAANWLMRTQDLAGGWTYSARDPGTMQRVTQGAVKPSMSAAGASSLYICAHLLGFCADARPKQEGAKLPTALQRVENEEDKRRQLVYLQPRNTSRQMVEQAGAGANEWFRKNPTYDIPEWTHYTMYGIERYQSFRELTEGRVVPEPDWYNQGVEYLRSTQLPNGSWQTKVNHNCGPPVDTAFGVLFLTRSAQKSIRKVTIDEGILIGGKGLPKNIENVRMQDGKVVPPQAVRDVDDLLKLIERSDNPDFDAKSLPGAMSLDEDLTKRNSQLQRLRALVSVDNFDTRLAAVKTLAQTPDLDNVPVLIFALGDPDWRVVVEAAYGLRFLSRRFEGFGPPPNATPEQVKGAQAKWKRWYLSIRPVGELLE